MTHPYDLAALRLAPCPFCGWERPSFVPAEIEDNELVQDAYVHCLECGGIGPSGDDGLSDLAIERWNRRADRRTPTPEADVLRRIRQWDVLDSAADGPFWKREIGAALSSRPAVEDPVREVLSGLLADLMTDVNDFSMGPGLTANLKSWLGKRFREVLSRSSDVKDGECARCRDKFVIGQRAAACIDAVLPENVTVEALQAISDRDIALGDIKAIKELGARFNWRERILKRRGSLTERSTTTSTERRPASTTDMQIGPGDNDYGAEGEER